MKADAMKRRQLVRHGLAALHWPRQERRGRADLAWYKANVAWFKRRALACLRTKGGTTTVRGKGSEAESVARSCQGLAKSKPSRPLLPKMPRALLLEELDVK